MENEAVQEALNLIKQCEGLKLKAYQDQRGIWTVGYGSTGMFVTQQTVWTADQALNNLQQRVEALYSVLRRSVVSALTPKQWAAVISLAYNVGVTSVTGSTLVRLINERDFLGAALEFPKWDHITIAGKKTEDKGLLNRRLKEQALFNSGIGA